MYCDEEVSVCSSSDSKEEWNTSSPLSEDAVSLSFFDRPYSSKEDISTAVVQYHLLNKRNMKLIKTIKSDKCRLYFKCSIDGCLFHLNFNFPENNINKPTSASEHTCQSTPVATTNNLSRIAHLCNLPEVQSWICAEKHNATTKGLKHLLQSLGFNVRYSVLYRCLKRLNRALFIKELTAGNTLPPVASKKRGRPKKHGIESQKATADLEVKKRKCGKCGNLGHYKPRCPQ
ncbi:hypothetical protein HMI54_000935 [Coelomomyces lativittatus]|nr:hypothetical protein HMI56_003918 [Coelomomyces lativittatus]KAJ1518407.1 hypothetical protein HMI54_000935 [Coelomomyces lativittatus]